MPVYYESICSEFADKIKRINDVIPEDFTSWHTRIKQILDKIETAKESSYSAAIRKEIHLEINTVFLLKALEDIYWPDMPPTQEWWKCLSEVCKMSKSLDAIC